MTTPGDMRRAQRKAARAKEPKPQATDLTPLELAIERKMRELARQQAPHATDAKAIAMIVVRHWGDEAPKVMQMAVEFTRDEIGRWSPDTSSKTAPGGSRREPSSEGQ